MADNWSDVVRSTEPMWVNSRIQISGAAIQESVHSSGAFTRAVAEEYARLMQQIQHNEERRFVGYAATLDYSEFTWLGIDRSQFKDFELMDPDMLMDEGL